MSGPNHSSLPPRGTILGGKYELLELAGQGGMASVWRARTLGAEGFQCPVAVKRIHDPVALNPEFVQMFVEEARVIAALRHPHIVQVHDFALDESGHYYIVMEWVDGLDLRTWALAHQRAGEPTPWHVVIAVGIETLNALACAHERVDAAGNPAPIFHRDVTPANILLDIGGTTKLSDFGLARAADRARMTKPMVVKGKLTYLSPEQSHGQDPSVQSDLFTMGIVLWEMLAGRKLYQGQSPLDIMKEVRAARIPPLADFRSDIPQEILGVIHRSLAKRPEERFPSARAMSRAFALLLRQIPKSTDAWIIGRSVAFARELLKESPVQGLGEVTESVAMDELVEVSDPLLMTTPIRGRKK